MSHGQHRYLPAAGHDWLLPLYDPLVTLLGGDGARRALVDQAAIRAGERVLDLGCGTGTLVTWLKRRRPDVEVTGIDPDPRALARARRKAARAAVSVRLDQGFSEALPYPDAAFDRVLSSFVLHHVEADQKEAALREVRRVLEPGGRFHLLDFVRPEHRRGGLVTRLLHSSARLRDNAAARVLALMREAGFVEARQVGARRLLVGRVAYYEASAPAATGDRANQERTAMGWRREGDSNPR